jgi:acetate kinase
MRILVVNAGSSSLKLSVLDGDELVDTSSMAAAAGRIDEPSIRAVIERNRPLDAVGHRIVHGGTAYVDAVRIDDQVRQRLDALTDLAPLHQPKSLQALDLVTALARDLPAVACFDTAFHARVPPAAATYALPAEWRARWPLRKFGFHGLSHAYASRRVAQLLGRDVAELRTITCHLGAGASLAAVDGGVSVDTTMGFTPLDGLVMATRSGSVDPGLVLWLEDHVGMPSTELASTLEHRSGLLGLAGSPDMREVLAAEDRGDEAAVLAVGVYLHRLRAGIAGMAAAMDGVDAIVFTGGVGERSASVRARAINKLSFLGLALDEQANEQCVPDAGIATSDSAPVWVIAAREDVEIARQVRGNLS